MIRHHNIKDQQRCMKLFSISNGSISNSLQKHNDQLSSSDKIGLSLNFLGNHSFKFQDGTYSFSYYSRKNVAENVEEKEKT
jgi:hypothetical protein